MITQGDRVGFKILEDGRKVRFFKSNDEFNKDEAYFSTLFSYIFKAS